MTTNIKNRPIKHAGAVDRRKFLTAVAGITAALLAQNAFKAPTRPSGKKHEDDRSVDRLALRDLPTREQLRTAFGLIREREGRVLCVFTHYALGYYNQTGQMGRALGVNGYRQFCTELFWPRVDHTYRLELHRRRLMERIKTWAGNYVRP